MQSVTDADTSRIGGASGAWLTTVSSPLTLETPINAKLPEPVRAITNLICTTAQTTLSKWDDFTFSLPHTAFQTEQPLVSVADLCAQPDESDELAELTLDPSGRRRRFTPQQCADVALYARFSFPSRRFPRVNHVWQLPAWMVRGRRNVQTDFQRRLGVALDHLLVYTLDRVHRKARLWPYADGSDLSVVNGVGRIVLQIKGVAAAFVGLPETVPRWREYKHRKLARDSYVRERCEASELIDFILYSAPSLAAPYSVRFADEQASAYDETYRLAALETFRHVSPDDLSTAERTALVGILWQEQWREEEIQTALEAESDERKRLVLAEYMRAQHIIEDGITKFQARIDREKLRLIGEAKRAHPILSLSEAWLERWITRNFAQRYTEWEREQQDENISLMRSCDLHRAAKFEETKLQFEREAWPDIRASWLRDRVPARVYEHTYINFNPRSWREGVEDDERHVRTTTAYPGWRLVLLWHDTVSYLHNGVYFTLVTNLWHGPVGVQALFRWGDVPYAWGSSAIGAAHATNFHMSMCSRLRAIWRRVRELRAEFEDAEDTVFGKNAVRWLHFIVNYGFRGALSTAVVIVGQPLLTVLNVAVTAVISATAVVWASLSALLTYCASWLLYDWRDVETYNIQYFHFGNSPDVFIYTSTERSPRWFPLFSHLARALLWALGVLVSGAGLVLHPIYSAFRAAVACAQGALRVPWDAMWHGLLRRFGRWPVRDSFLARRVGGVGVSDSYYFRLSTELVLRCLRARLEQIELEEARGIIEKAAMKPVRELEKFIEGVVAGLCERPWEGAGTMKKLQKEEEERMERIRSEFERRESMLSRLTDMPQEKGRIRPEKGVPSEQMLEKCVELVETFHEERIKRLGDVSTMLWRRAAAAPGDLKTLTRYLLADLFSEEFLTPVETSEETLEIPVTFDDLINVHAKKRA